VRSFPLSHSRVCVGYTLEETMRPGVFHPEKAREREVPMGPFWSQLQAGQAVTLADGRVVESSEVVGNPRPGCKFSYVTDTVPHPSIVPAVNGSDLLLCEGGFSRDLEDSAREKRHLTSTQAAQIAKAAGVRKMGLVHYSPRCNEKDLKRLLTEAREVFPDTFLSRDGQIIDIPNRDEA